jgi:hypothetical protein
VNGAERQEVHDAVALSVRQAWPDVKRKSPAVQGGGWATIAGCLAVLCRGGTEGAFSTSAGVHGGKLGIMGRRVGCRVSHPKASVLSHPTHVTAIGIAEVAKA